MISRWGVTLYWSHMIETHRFALTRVCKNLFLQDLICFFFSYGLSTTYFCGSSPLNRIIFFKWQTLTQQEFIDSNINHSYEISHVVNKNVFPSRVWFLQFNRWLIFVFFSFAQLFFPPRLTRFAMSVRTRNKVFPYQPFVSYRYMRKKCCLLSFTTRDNGIANYMF